MNSRNTSTQTPLESDLNDLYDSMNKIIDGQDSLVVGQVKHTTQLDSTNERITRIEDRVDQGHDCRQGNNIKRIEKSIDVIEEEIKRDIRAGIKHGGRLETVENSVNKQEARSRNSWILAISMFMGLLGSGIGVVYGYGTLQTNVANDRTVNAAQHKIFTKSIESANKRVEDSQSRNTKQIESQIHSLRVELASSNGHAERYESVCEGMRSYEKRVQRNLMSKHGRRVPESCQ